MVCTLGNFATKLLSGRPDGISRVHGHELPIEIGGHRVLLYPLFHPAAALYTRAMLATLEADFARIPELLAGPRRSRARARAAAPPVAAAAPPAPALRGRRRRAEDEQLGLF